MEAIPVVDLRLLTQAEINALSRACSSAAGDPRCCDDLVIPKIDRAVFNESAGSRKQTYSRLRLAPRKPPELSSPSSSVAARGRRPSVGLHSSAPPPHSNPGALESDDPGRQENKKIVLFLRQLFAKKGVEIPNAAAANDESAAFPSACASAELSAVADIALRKRGREPEVTEEVNGDSEVLSMNGVVVDLAGLGVKEDPFGSELKRRTQGLVTEEEFLGFLSGLEGQWGSRRKRRRIVDAGKFGDVLPKGWKVLLALKRKDGNVWLHCRRYISPSGKQFITCKEVSLYLLSLTGPQEPTQENAAQSMTDRSGNEHTVGQSPQVNLASPSCSSMTPISTLSSDCGKQTVVLRVDNPANAQLQDVVKFQKCNLAFADKGAHVQHLPTFHRSSRKRRGLGQSIVDGVIIRDGKYECQFCHKMFTERRRYNGHVGIHVKYCDRSLGPVENEIIMEKNIIPSSDGANSTFAELSNSVDSEKETELVKENVTTESIYLINDGSLHGNEHVGNTGTDHMLKCHDNGQEKIMMHESCTTEAVCEIKNSFPLSNNYNDDKERNAMQERCALPNDERNDSYHRNNILIENRKIDENMKYPDIQSLTQEVCNSQCIGEINDASHPNNKQTKVTKIDCFSKFNKEISDSRHVDSLANDYGMTDQKHRVVAETGNVMNGDMHPCLDHPLTHVGTCTSEGSSRNDLSNNVNYDEMERPSTLKIACESQSIGISGGDQNYAETVLSSGSVIDGIENNENKICLDSNLKIFSGTRRSNMKNAAVCMTNGLAEVGKCGNEPEDGLGCVNIASERRGIVASILHDELQQPETEKRFLEDSMMVPSDRKYFGINTVIGDMPPSSGEELMLDIMDQSGTLLKDDLMSDNTVLNADVPRNDLGFAGEGNMQSLSTNMPASWEQTSAHLPFLEMISDQGDGHLHYLNGNREGISCFEGMRLDKIKPQKFVVSTDLDAMRRPEEPMVEAAWLEHGAAAYVQLQWDSSSPNSGPRRGSYTTICAWCSAEFEHEDVDIEVQPGSIGFMCPTCKARM